MSYSKSNARVVYDTVSIQLLSLASSTKALPLATLSYSHRDLIYKSIIVLICSSIEEYHKTFIEDWFYRLKTSNVQMDKIPMNARMLGFLHSTEHTYKNFLFDRDSEKDIIDKLAKSKHVLKKYVDDTESFDISRLSKIVWSNKKYPSVKNVATLYNRLGISNIFNVLSALKHKDYKSRLDSLLSVRESIAHAGAGAVTFADVERHIKFVDDLIHELDRVLHKHCCKIAGITNWPR